MVVSEELFANVNLANTGAVSLGEYLAWTNVSFGEGKVDKAMEFFLR